MVSDWTRASKRVASMSVPSSSEWRWKPDDYGAQSPSSIVALLGSAYTDRNINDAENRPRTRGDRSAGHLLPCRS